MSLSVLVPQVDIRRVDLCAVANVPTLSGTGGTLDGVTIQAGMVLLLTAQTDPAQNGAWLVPASGAWRQSAFPGQDRYFLVGSGSAQAGTLWRIQGAPNWGVDSITVSQVGLQTNIYTGILEVAHGGTGLDGTDLADQSGFLGGPAFGGPADLALRRVQYANRAVFLSSILTGTGAPQNTPHGLGQIPSATRAWLVEVPAGGANISGSVDATNATYTVTAGARYQFLCEL